jgi:gamma-glutamyltranspeptidase/glutathione hydrolase
MTRIFSLALMLFSSLWLAGCAQNNIAMVATANRHASRAAADILARGGTAMDAAVAAQLVLGLVEPQSSGIGGGAFALYWQNSRARLTSFDGREKAPSQADDELFLDDAGKAISWPSASIGGRAVGAPGVIALLWKGHRKFGRLQWAQLFEPAIKLAQNGFEVSRRLHNALKRSQKELLHDLGARQLYFHRHSLEPVPVGHVLKNPAYAKTLKRIAENGPDGFYRGPVAAAIVEAVETHQGNPGLLTLEDLANYQAIERPAVCGFYRSFKVCGMGPPTSGGLTVLMILGMLEPFDIGALEPSSPRAMHLFTQASRLAYADRGVYMADADFVKVPVKGLLDKTYLRARARRINPLIDSGKAVPGTPPPADENVKKAAGLVVREYGTSHFSIVDGQGNAISMTTSVERSFGAHITAAGFVLNNQLTDFNFVPVKNGVAVANRPGANKRPRSSMSPTMVFDGQGRLFASLGSPGGSRIIEFVARTVIGLLDWKLSMQEAISLGNVNNRNRYTELEAGTNVAGFAEMFVAMGHKVKVRALTSGLHGVRITATGLDGGADPRREGMVIELEK